MEVGADGVFPKASESGGMTCVNEALSRYSPHEEGEGTGPDINGPKQLPRSLPQCKPSTPWKRRGWGVEGESSLMEQERERGKGWRV